LYELISEGKITKNAKAILVNEKEAFNQLSGEILFCISCAN